MKIQVTISTSQSERMFESFAQNLSNSDDEVQKSHEMEFLLLRDSLEKISNKNGFKFEKDTKVNHEHYMNGGPGELGPVYSGGGIEIWETIQTVSVYAGSVAGLFELFNLALPALKKYLKKSNGDKKIKVKFGKYTVSAQSEKDLKQALKAIKGFENGEKKAKKQKK